MNRCQLLLFVTLVRSAVFAADTSAPQNPQVFVCAYKEAEVSDAILEKAEEQTANLFRRSLPMLLHTCSNDLPRTQGRAAISAAEFYIHVVPKAASLSDDAFGVAFLGSDGSGRYADVFFDSVRRLQADQRTASTAEILGYVMAHEIGHLLLGFHAHSSTGIMEARWSGSELQSIAMGRLAFTPEQCRRLFRRAELMKHEHEVAATKAADFAR